jgi:hypothetical protein
MNEKQEVTMAEEKRKWHRGAQGGAAGGMLWFIGFLFTWGFVNMVWWKILLSIIIWPYFLGQAVR